MASPSSFVSIINHLFVTFNHDGTHISGLYFPSKKKRRQQKTKPGTKHTQKVHQIVNNLGSEGTLYLHAFILL